MDYKELEGKKVDVVYSDERTEGIVAKAADGIGITILDVATGEEIFCINTEKDTATHGKQAAKEFMEWTAASILKGEIDVKKDPLRVKYNGGGGEMMPCAFS